MTDTVTHRVGLDRAVRSGVRDVLPIILSLIPFGFAIGAAVAASAVDNLAGWLGGPLLLAGSAHIAIVNAIDSGAGFAAALVIVVMINSRFAAYSAGMVSLFSDQPRWFRLVGPFALVDQLFALAGQRGKTFDPPGFRRYWMGLTLPLGMAWTVTISLGMWLGPLVPAQWGLIYSVPLIFVAMAVPSIQDRSSIWAGSTAAIVALVGANWLAGLGVLLAIVAGVIAGILTGRSPGE